jgi:DNA replication licensing factor MCM3
MSPHDRVAMHEAMEQQTVTIAKAGIHASLNARCSVLAAANPVYGFYSVRHKLSFNVGLPESLLSRFDLVFIILDQHSAAYNRRIGKHILRDHMTAEPAKFDSLVFKTIVPQDQKGVPEENENTAVSCTGETIVSLSFLRRYVAYAKALAPLLTESSQRLICQHYVQLRSEQQDGGDGFFVTARTLESIVRLATAHAKLRLSQTVEDDDVTGAMELIRASVHAARSAAAIREEDNAAGRDEEPPGKKSRGELVNPAAALETVGGGAAVIDTVMDKAFDQRVLDVLRSFRREGRSSLHLHEVRERLGRDAVELQKLQRVVSSLQGDAFVYESTETEDLIQFV